MQKSPSNRGFFRSFDSHSLAQDDVAFALHNVIPSLSRNLLAGGFKIVEEGLAPPEK